MASPPMGSGVRGVSEEGPEGGLKPGERSGNSHRDPIEGEGESSSIAFLAGPIPDRCDGGVATNIRQSETGPGIVQGLGKNMMSRRVRYACGLLLLASTVRGEQTALSIPRLPGK